MLCDNKQTIDLIHKDIAVLKTKLRHVDIHNHWLREAARSGTIKVTYVPTKEQLADGLTKNLPGPQHAAWRHQIGLIDRADHLHTRGLKELDPLSMPSINAMFERLELEETLDEVPDYVATEQPEATNTVCYAFA